MSTYHNALGTFLVLSSRKDNSTSTLGLDGDAGNEDAIGKRLEASGEAAARGWRKADQGEWERRERADETTTADGSSGGGYTHRIRALQVIGGEEQQVWSLRGKAERFK